MAENKTYKTALEMLYHWEKTKPNEVFLKQPVAGKWHTFTWKQTADAVRQLAGTINALNLPEKSNIALISKNCAHWIITDLAIMMSGHVSVPIYPNIGPDTLNYVLEHSESKLLFIGKLDDWDKMKSGVPDGLQCVTFPKSFYGEDGYQTWEDFQKDATPVTGEPQRALEDSMTIIYTSGTTGNPKGVVQTFEALSFAINSALEIIEIGEDARFFSYLPMCHIAERMLVEMGGIFTGSIIYFAQSLDTFASNLGEAQPTVFLGVPRIWTKFKMGILSKMPQSRLNLLLSIPIVSGVVKKSIRKKLGLNEAQYCFTGAAPTPTSLMQWFEKLGINIQEVYGMTENCAYSHYTRKDKIKHGSPGQPMPYVDAKISDKGEILIKSKANMVGYYKQPDLTTECFENGYLCTGDCGEIDNQGFLKITGRVKDIFKTAKGKYVAPNPIEMKLAKNEHVEQVCVVGTGLPQPMALFVLSEGGRSQDKTAIAESLSSLIKEVNPSLDKHERLKKAIVLKDDWTVENELLTPTLKIKRNPIEKKFRDNYENWYEKNDMVVWE